MNTTSQQPSKSKNKRKNKGSKAKNNLSVASLPRIGDLSNAASQPKPSKEASCKAPDTSSQAPRSPSKRPRPDTPADSTFTSDKEAAPTTADSTLHWARDRNGDLQTFRPEDLHQGGKFRTGAGGSLRMPKKRASRPPVMDIQWAAKEGSGSSVPKSAPPEGSYGRFGCLGDDAEQDTASTPSGPTRPSSAGSQKSGLDPRASAFITPKENHKPASRDAGPGNASGATSRTVSGDYGQSSQSYPIDEKSLEKVDLGEKPSDNPVEAVPEGTATLNVAEKNGHPSEDKGKAVQSEVTLIAETKPKKKKKNKKKKKQAANPEQPVLDPWPQLPNGPHDRAYTVNDAPAAWPAGAVSLSRDKVADLISPHPPH